MCQCIIFHLPWCIRAVVKFLNCAVYFPDDNSEKYPGILYPGDMTVYRCSVILPGYWKIPGYLTKNTRVFFSTPVLLTNTRVFSIKYPGIWQPVKYPGKWQLMTAETTCGLFRRISGVLSFTDFSLSSSLMLDACNLYTALLELKKLRGLREWLLLKGGKPGGGGSDHGLYDSPWSDCKQI